MENNFEPTLDWRGATPIEAEMVRDIFLKVFRLHRQNADAGLTADIAGRPIHCKSSSGIVLYTEEWQVYYKDMVIVKGNYDTFAKDMTLARIFLYDTRINHDPD